jgi:predicted dehydrogenase
LSRHDPQQKAFRLAVIGCGRIARAVHLPVLAAMTDVRVVAIADSDPAALDAARRIVPCAERIAGDAALYTRDDVDALVICLPSHLHAEAAVAALEAGKAVYLEKPIATDLAGAREVVDAAQRAGRAAMVGFNYRFHPLVADLRRRVMAGEIGEVRGWRSTFTTRASGLPTWKRAIATGGGVALDLLSHHVDLLRFVTGREVREVFATTAATSECDEDSAALHLALDTGIVAQLSASWSSPEDDRIEVVGEKGTLYVDRHRSLGVGGRLSTAASRGALLRSAVPSFDLVFAAARFAAPRREPSFELALRHFVMCLREGQAPSPGLDAGLRSLEVVVAARASAKDGRLHRTGA